MRAAEISVMYQCEWLWVLSIVSSASHWELNLNTSGETTEMWPKLKNWHLFTSWCNTEIKTILICFLRWRVLKLYIMHQSFRFLSKETLLEREELGACKCQGSGQPLPWGALYQMVTPTVIFPRAASPGTPEMGQVNSWDSRREFDPAVTLCAELPASPLLGWPLPDFLFVSLCLCLSRSPSHLLSRELREQEGMKRGIVLCWMQAVCQFFSGCPFSTRALCNYADVAALACHSGHRSKEHVLTSVIFTTLSICHSSASHVTHTEHVFAAKSLTLFSHSHLYTNDFLSLNNVNGHSNTVLLHNALRHIHNVLKWEWHHCLATEGTAFVSSHILEARRQVKYSNICCRAFKNPYSLKMSPLKKFHLSNKRVTEKPSLFIKDHTAASIKTLQAHCAGADL